MKATLKVTLKPFTVPNFVIIETPPGRRQDGVDFESPKVALNDLEPEDLDRLCEEFRRAVFDKAGKCQPPTPAIVCPKCFANA